MAAANPDAFPCGECSPQSCLFDGPLRTVWGEPIDECPRRGPRAVEAEQAAADTMACALTGHLLEPGGLLAQPHWLAPALAHPHFLRLAAQARAS